MSVLLDFPLKTLRPGSIALFPDYNTRPGHEATNGMRRSLGMSGSQFRLVLGDIVMHNRVDRIRTLRALIANLESDRCLIRIRIPDLHGIDGPWSVATKAGRLANPDGIPFATDVMYATGVGHAVPTLEAYFAASATMGETDVYLSGVTDLPAGCAISIDEFCYMIAGSWTEDGLNRIKLSPPLRKAAGAGDVVSLAPIFVGHCVTSAPGYEALRFGKFGSHSLEFVEDLTRLVEVVA